MVEDEYLGGAGSGSGKVAFRNLAFTLRKLEYIGDNTRLPLLTKEDTTFDIDELIQSTYVPAGGVTAMAVQLVKLLPPDISDTNW